MVGWLLVVLWFECCARIDRKWPRMAVVGFKYEM